ncbi:MAG TPA: hypothetical protein VMR52_11665 [Dehalococcoidia bacterium]|nr:hypothetical protein [Dehalococcoidia bacterium]
MGSFDIGAGFGTSFVVAAFVVVIFLASRLGGDTEVLRRGIQVAIAFALFLLTISATTAIIRPPDLPGDSSEIFSGDEPDNEYLSDVASKASGAGSVHAGVGIILAIVGAVLFKRMQVIPLGLMFGGLLLLLLGAPPGASNGDPLSAYYAVFISTVGRADAAWDIARLTVLAAGTVGLLMYAYYEYEIPARQSDAPPDEPDGDAPEAAPAM